MPEGVTACTVATSTGDNGALAATATSVDAAEGADYAVIPKGTAVLLRATGELTASASHTFTPVGDATELSGTNELRGCDTQATVATNGTDSLHHQFSLHASNTSGSAGSTGRATTAAPARATPARCTCHRLQQRLHPCCQGHPPRHRRRGAGHGRHGRGRHGPVRPRGIHAIAGQRITGDPRSLPAGLRIINGKKTLVK